MKYTKTTSAYSLASTYDKTIKITQPKLISFPNYLPPSNAKFIETKNMSNNEEAERINKEGENLKEKVNTINKENAKKEKEPKKKSEMERNILKYYENPFLYMDYLLEKVFQNRYINSLSDDEIKEIIKKDYENLLSKLAKKFGDFAKRQKIYLKSCEAEINKRLLIKRNKYKLKENAEFQSEPLYKGENIIDILGEGGRDKFNVMVNSKKNLAHDITDEPESRFHTEKLSKEALSCLKLNQIEVPKKEFLVVKDIHLDNNELFQHRKELDLERNKKKNEEEFIKLMVENYEKNSKNKNMIFDDLYNRNIQYYDKMKNENEKDFEFLLYIKKSMEEHKMFDDLTITNLRLLGFSMEEIRKLLLSKDKHFFLGALDSDEKINQRIKDNEEYNTICNKELQDLYAEFRPKEIKPRPVTDKELDELNKKYKLDQIGNRIYYNDNPYHYGYKYTGSSINIKKQLEKVYKNDKPKSKVKKSK